MKIVLKKILLILIVGLSTISCIENEDFSSDPNLKIDFPSDVISFDTVFTSVISPVQKLYVSNKNNHSISLESIELMNAKESGFRINVNGQAGTIFRNEELLKKDSILLAVDIKAPSLENGALLEDKIKLIWNGNTVYISLQAYAIPIEIWDDKTISKNTALSANKGYYIRGDIVVSENSTLTIDEGTQLYFDKNASLTIHGKIIANGSIKHPIVFRGHRFDYIEPGVLYDHASDQWKGITIGKTSFDNLFQNVRIRNSKQGIIFSESSPNKLKAQLINTIIHNTSEEGMRASNCNIIAVNCQISNSKGSLLNLTGGIYSFLHCTIANYYQWHPRMIASVILNDSKSESETPIHAEFTNCIITGTFKDELNDYYDNTISSSKFVNCVIQISKIRETPNFIATQWNMDQVFLFKDLNYDGSFFYSFELLDQSIAKNNASILHANKAAYDLRGISRLTDGKPDIGCYEYTN